MKISFKKPLGRTCILSTFVVTVLLAGIQNSNAGSVGSVHIVDTLVDENDGSLVGGLSLRDAINESWYGDRIIFDPALGVDQTITLTEPLPEIYFDLEIDGESSGIIISGDNQFPVLTITGGSQLSFKNLKIHNGLAKGGDGGSSNTGGGGGAPGIGGGAYVDAAQEVLFENVEFSGNRAMGGNGGAIVAGGNPGGGGGGGQGGAGGSPALGEPGDGGLGRIIGASRGRSSESRPEKKIKDPALSSRAYPGGSAGCPADDGYLGSGGGGGTDTCPGGNGVASGGGGGIDAGGNGGFGGGGGGGATTNGAGGMFGGDAIAGGGGGGGGLGGAIYVGSTYVTMVNCSFYNNQALRGTGGNTGSPSAANNGQGKGGAIFVESNGRLFPNGLSGFYGGGNTADDSLYGDDESTGQIGLMSDSSSIYGTLSAHYPNVTNAYTVDSQPLSGATADFLFAFDSDVDGVDVSDFSVTLLSGTGTSSVTGLTQNAPDQYTVTISLPSSEGELTVSLIDNNSIYDSSSFEPLGGPLTGDGDFSTFGYDFDNQAPSATIETVTSPRNSPPSSIIVDFSEGVTNVTLASLQLTLDGVPVSIVSPSGEGAISGTGSTRTIAGNLFNASITDDGLYEFSILPGTITDYYGNVMTTGASVSWELERVSPTLDLTALTSSPTTASQVDFELISSEPIQPLVLGDSLTIGNNGFPVTWTDVHITTTSSTLSLISVVGVDGDGPLYVTVVAKDLIGNSEYIQESVVIDNTKPSISGTPGGFRAGTSANAYVFFTESVLGLSDLSQLDIITDVSYTNATLDPGEVPPPTNYFQITIDGISEDGTISLRIPAGTITDQAGLTNDEITITDLFTIDNTPPTVESITYRGTSPTGDSDLEFDVVFSEPVRYFSDRTFLNLQTTGTATAYSSWASFHSEGPANEPSDRALISITNTFGTGDLSIGVTAGGIQDRALNGIVEFPTEFRVALDNDQPEVISITSSTGNLNVSGPKAGAYISLSKPVYGFGIEDLQISTDLAGYSNATLTPLTPTLYHLQFTGLINYAGDCQWPTYCFNSNGDISVRVIAGGATDSLGNTLRGSTAEEILQIDSNPPKYAFDFLPGTDGSSDPFYQDSPTTLTLRLSEAVVDLDRFDFTLLVDGQQRSLSENTELIKFTDTRYELVNFVDGITDQGRYFIYMDAGAVKDAVGNPLVTGYSDREVIRWNIDNLRPSVEMTTLSGNPNRDTTLLFFVEFSEPITGFDSVHDFNLGEFSGNSWSYTGFSITPTSPQNYQVRFTGVQDTGNFFISVKEGIASDPNGLTNTESNEISFVVDHDPPFIVSAIPSVSSPTNVSSYFYTVTFSEPVTTFYEPYSGVQSVNNPSFFYPYDVEWVKLSPTEYRVEFNDIRGLFEFPFEDEGDLALKTFANVFYDQVGLTAPAFTTPLTHIDQIPPSRFTLDAGFIGEENFGIDQVHPFEIDFSFYQPVNGLSASNLLLLRDGVPVDPAPYFLSNQLYSPGDNRTDWTLLTQTSLDLIDGDYELALTNVETIVNDLGTPFWDGSFEEIDEGAKESFIASNRRLATWSLDVTKPVATITRISPELISPQQEAAFEVSFSEDVTGLDVTDLVFFGNGVTLGTPQLTILNPKLARVQVPILGTSGLGVGTISSRLIFDRVEDAAGNTNDDTLGETISVDGSKPTVISVTRNSPDPTNVNTVTFTTTFSEEVTLVDAAKVAAVTKGSLNTNPVSLSLDPTDHTIVRFTVSSISGDGDLRLEIASGAFQDSSNNLNNPLTTGFGLDNQVRIDNTSPELTYYIYSSPTSSEEISVTVLSNESVTGLTEDKFSIETTGGLTYAGTEFEGTQSSAVMTVLGLDGEGTMNIFLSNNVGIDDLAGNRLLLPAKPIPVTRIQPILVLGSRQLDISEATRSVLNGPAQTFNLLGKIQLLDSGQAIATIETDETTPLIYDAANQTLSGVAPIMVPNVPTVTGSLALTTSPWIINQGISLSPTTADLFETTVAGIQMTVCDYTLGYYRDDFNVLHNVFEAKGALAIDGPEAIGFSGLLIASNVLEFRDGHFLYQGGSLCDPATGVNRLSLDNGVFSTTGITLPAGTILGVTPALNHTGVTISNGASPLTLAGSFDYEGFPITFGSAKLKANLNLALSDLRFSVDVPITPNADYTSGVGFTIETATMDASDEFTFGDGSFIIDNSRVTFSEPEFGGNSVTLGDVVFPTGDGDITITDVYASNLAEDPGIFAEESDVFYRGLRFILDDSGFFSLNSLQADTIYISNIDDLTIPLKKFKLNASGFSLGGGGFDIGGLRFIIAVAGDTSSSEGLQISGSLQLPENLAGGAGFGADITILGNRVLLNGIEFCTPAVDKLNIKNTKFDLPNICFSYEAGPPTRYSGDTTFAIPEIIDLDAGIGIADGRLDYLSVGVSDLDKPIGSTGAFLQGISATLSNLAQLRACVTIDGRRVCWTPPITLAGTVEATAGPEVLGFSALSAEATVTVSEISFGIDGNVTVVIFEMGSAYAKIAWAGPERGTAFGGRVVYLSVIVGKFDGFIGFDGYVLATASVSVEVPQEIPIIGGYSIGSADARLEVDPNRDPDWKFTAKGKINLLVTDVKFTVTIDANGKVSFRQAERSIVAPWETPFYQPIAIDNTNERALQGGPDTVYMSAFNEFDQTFKAYSNENRFPPKGRGLLPETTINIPLTASGDSQVIRLTYEEATGDPAFTLTSPSGKVLTPANVVGSIPSANTYGAYLANSTVRDASYFIVAEETGNYVATILHPETLGQYAIEVLTQNAEPTFDFESVVVDGSDIAFSWNAFDIDDNARIDLYLDVDREGSRGIRVLDTLSETDGPGIALYDLATSPLSSGWYWPYAVINDERNAPVTVFADEPVFIPSADSPSAIHNVEVERYGNNLFVTWDPVSDPDLHFYRIKYTDDPESGFYKFDQVAQATETTAVLADLRPNVEYKVTVVPVILATSSPSSRAAMLNTIHETAEVLVTAKVPAKDRRKTAVTIFEASPQGREAARNGGRPASAIADQAVELAKFWDATDYPSKRNKDVDELLRFKRSARSMARSLAEETAYQEAPTLATDNVETTGAVGGNNSPVYTNDPITIVNAGELYDWTATAEDPDGGSVTFELTAGPTGMTVSSNGLVSWQTTTDDGGSHIVTIDAIDEAGARTELAYDLTVTTIFFNPEIFAITSKAPTDIFPGEFYSYSPVLTSTFTTSTLSQPTWSLVAGPSGMIIDELNGGVFWQTLPSDTDAPLVIIRVDLSTTKGIQTAFQEFRVNVSENGDIIEVLSIDGDGDSDGVPDEEEDSFPGGDGNGDSIADSTQSNVATLMVGSGPEFITIESPIGTFLQQVTHIDRDALPRPLPPASNLQLGMVSFTVGGVVPGSEIAVRQVYHASDLPSINEFYKLNPNTNSYFLFPEEKASIGVDEITILLTDNNIGFGDFNPTLGLISDPGGSSFSNLLEVVLLDFTARDMFVNGVSVTWRTASELGSAGFYIHRAELNGSGDYTLGEKLSDLIIAEGDVGSGASYEFTDQEPLAEGEIRGYILRELENTGRFRSYGPIFITGGERSSNVADWFVF